MAAYEQAFNRLDREAVRRIFPTVPDQYTEGLGDFKSYSMKVEIRGVELKLPRVFVEVRVSHDWVTFSGKGGSTKPKKETWVFLEGREGWFRAQ